MSTDDARCNPGELSEPEPDISARPAVAPAPVSPAPVCAPTLPAMDNQTVGEMLPPAQQLAMEHLAAGSSITEAARLAGVRRETLHRWLRDDPEFVAAFNAWRNEIRSAARTRLLATLSEAVDTVQRAIRTGDARLAYRLLQSMRVTSPLDPLPPADEDPRLVKKLMKIVARDRREQLDSAANPILF